MKITKRQLRKIIKEEYRGIVREMNSDGTISATEEEDREDLLMHAEIQIDELIQMVKNGGDLSTDLREKKSLFHLERIQM